MSGRPFACLVLVLANANAAAQGADGQQFPPAQIRQGSEIYAQNCAPCHGPRLMDPNAAFDLRKFPPTEKARFISAVTKGKNQMPPWGDLFKPEEIEALWAYVMAGEKR